MRLVLTRQRPRRPVAGRHRASDRPVARRPDRRPEKHVRNTVRPAGRLRTRHDRHRAGHQQIDVPSEVRASQERARRARRSRKQAVYEWTDGEPVGKRLVALVLDSGRRPDVAEDRAAQVPEPPGHLAVAVRTLGWLLHSRRLNGHDRLSHGSEPRRGRIAARQGDPAVDTLVGSPHERVPDGSRGTPPSSRGSGSRRREARAKTGRDCRSRRAQRSPRSTTTAAPPSGVPLSSRTTPATHPSPMAACVASDRGNRSPAWANAWPAPVENVTSTIAKGRCVDMRPLGCGESVDTEGGVDARMSVGPGYAPAGRVGATARDAGGNISGCPSAGARNV